jgi:hypothetical protein
MSFSFSQAWALSQRQTDQPRIFNIDIGQSLCRTPVLENQGCEFVSGHAAFSSRTDCLQPVAAGSSPPDVFDKNQSTIA